jgi:hypothetical protein
MVARLSVRGRIMQASASCRRFAFQGAVGAIADLSAARTAMRRSR